MMMMMVSNVSRKDLDVQRTRKKDVPMACLLLLVCLFVVMKDLSLGHWPI